MLRWSEVTTNGQWRHQLCLLSFVVIVVFIGLFDD
jgi:hypothetical protein